MAASDPPTVLVRTRVPVGRLRKAEQILEQLGLKTGDAVNMLLAQIELRGALPFEVTTRPVLLSADEQAQEWTDALGSY